MYFFNETVRPENKSFLYLKKINVRCCDEEVDSLPRTQRSRVRSLTGSIDTNPSS